MTASGKALDVVFRRWPWKLLAIALAYLLWLAITSEARSLQDFLVPVAVSLPEDVLLEGPQATRVNVRLSGPVTLLRWFEPRAMEVHVDLRDAAPGERSVQLDPTMVRGVDRGLEVVLIEPNRLQLRLARRTSRELPVAPSFTGTPPRGFELYGWSASPATVTVEGPEAVVAAMRQVPTDPIPLDPHEASFALRVALSPESPDVRVVDLPETVQVRVDVDATAIRREFDDIAVRVAGGNHRVKIEPRAVRISLSGPPRLLKTLRADQLTVVVDVSGLTARPEPYTLTPRIEFAGIADADLPLLRDSHAARRRIAVWVPGGTASPEGLP